MRPNTRIADLCALLDLRAADRAVEAAAAAARDAATSRDLQRAAATAAGHATAAAAADAARACYAKRTHHRRGMAEATLRFANTCANHALAVGGDYSGDTGRRVQWGDAPGAVTNLTRGDHYSRRCTWRRNDAVHAVTLDPTGAVGLYDARDNLVPASARDGLPLIACYPGPDPTAPVRAVWVVARNKHLSSVAGWVAYDSAADTCYHSTRSPEHAARALARKVAALRAEHAARAAAARNNRRARLVARLCRGVTATLDDARRLGYCTPGIRAFQDRHGIGDTASLPALVHTGNPAAVRLALDVARRVARAS